MSCLPHASGSDTIELAHTMSNYIEYGGKIAFHRFDPQEAPHSMRGGMRILRYH
jgi:hypothetical protein